ncbi:MAG: phosphoribosyltransferase family protein [Robiginitomaculum sp.]|nr:phosphoribosyltransferase family protein [Robiginitomaculum sp.]MDQ7076996.1 phosphoribosyltransferase family protein [Robiginitomaculum sp.]
MTIKKDFIDAQDLLRDSYILAEKIVLSGFRPDYIVGVWRGGTPVGIAVQEALDFCGIPSDHIAIRTSSYHGIEQQDDNVRVHGLHYLVENMNAEDNLLILDDVFDSGRSIDAIICELTRLCRRNMPSDVRTGTVYYKPTKNKTKRVPDYYVHETETWLVFPHELDGLSEDEVRAHKEFPETLIEMHRLVSEGADQ